MAVVIFDNPKVAKFLVI